MASYRAAVSAYRRFSAGEGNENTAQADKIRNYVLEFIVKPARAEGKTEIEIISGLQAGEKVVEGPYKALSKELADGKKVKEEEPGKKGEAGKAKGS